MKLVFIIGNGAVGKMTVGQELMKRTGLRLFHNHMTIEPVIELFGGYNGAAVNRLREVVFEEFAKTDNYGLIFTYVWAFSEQADWDYIAGLKKLFEDHGAQVDFVELVAPLEERLRRNQTENRLKEKPSKRNTAFSAQLVMHAEEKYRCVSKEGEFPYERYLRLDNTNLSPEETAEKIAKHFGYENRY